MSSQDSRGGAANSLRDRRVARVIDREIAPIWHDRFARLIIRNLPSASDVIALDIHAGVGRTTAELLHRLGPAARVLALEPDDTLIELARTRMRPEWKNRVYLKPGNFDDITAMADDSYNLVVANLVLGEAGDLGSALAEMIRINRIGGRILATLPVAGSWNEVEDIFSEVLRDAGLHAAVRRLERLRELRPTGPQLADIVRRLGVVEDDFVIEQERFQMLFPSGREFLFAPVVEHGPLRLWKAVIGKDGSPQELFWRLKEAIDTYYTGHVLAVNVIAGLINVHVAKGTESPGPRLAARFWRHYPGLDALWGGLAAGYVRVSEPKLPPLAGAETDFDFDLEIDEGRTGAQKAVTTSLPFAMDDLADEPDAPSDEPAAAKPAAKPTPTRHGVRPRPMAHEASRPIVTEPVRPAARITRPARPVVAEDDFSDINEPAPPRDHTDHTNNYADQADPSEEADPTSPFPISELREARKRSGPIQTAQQIPSRDDQPTAMHEDDAAHALREEDDDAAIHEDMAALRSARAGRRDDSTRAPQPLAFQDDDSAVFRDEPHDDTELIRSGPDDDDDTELLRPGTPVDDNPPPPDPLPTQRTTPDSGVSRRPEAEPSPTFRPPPDSGLFRRPSPTTPNSPSLGTPRTTPDSGVFRRPLASGQGTPAREPRSSGESSGFLRPPEPARSEPRPSGESSGSLRPPEPASRNEPSGLLRPFEPSRNEPSGLLRPSEPRTSGESSGFLRPPEPTTSRNEPSGLLPRSPARPSGESSGLTPRPASESSRLTGESSGFLRPPEPSRGEPRPSGESSGFLRPPAPISTTGSFKVFAPPKPGAKDPGASASNLVRPRLDPDEPTAEPTADRLTTDRPAAETPPADSAPPTRVPLAERLAATLADDDVPDELDEAEPIEELDDEPPIAAAPPRPKAPPPPPSGAFKPRPLLPIIPPPKPKK